MGEVARLFQEPIEDVTPATEPEALRIAEALVFAAAEPLDEATIAGRLPEGSDVSAVMAELQRTYAGRGVNLVRVARKWAFRTAADLSWLLSRDDKEQKKLSRAAIETLAIIAYHQPVTRADIEEIRGVAVSKGALDVLMETGWIRLRGRRKAPGRPITYGTTTDFLIHFGLEAIGDLPGLDELKGAGLFEGRLPSGFGVPSPTDDPALAEDEEPLEETAAVVEAYGPQIETEDEAAATPDKSLEDEPEQEEPAPEDEDLGA
jgi:segregation and condensation protein B